jgi:hypothetical protein
MVSISNYLRDEGRESETALRRGFRLVLRLVEIHAVEGDEVEYARFRSGMQGTTSKFSDDTPRQDVLIMVGKVATERPGGRTPP